MDTIVKFNVRGKLIETDIEPLLSISYFKGINEIRGNQDIVFIDLQPEAFEDVINYIKFSNYKISVRHAYIFDFLCIDITEDNLAEQNLKKCTSCKNYTELENYKSNSKFCTKCACAYMNCNERKVIDNHCNNHGCRLCDDIKVFDSDYCVGHMCKYQKCVNMSDSHRYCRDINCKYTKCGNEEHNRYCKYKHCPKMGYSSCTNESHKDCTIRKCNFAICDNDEHKICKIITDQCYVLKCPNRQGCGDYCSEHN